MLTVTAELMTEHPPVAHLSTQIRKETFPIGVQVRPADATGADPQQRLAFFGQLGLINLLESYVSDPVHHRCFHTITPVCA
jgi:hypothetical protein